MLDEATSAVVVVRGDVSPADKVCRLDDDLVILPVAGALVARKVSALVRVSFAFGVVGISLISEGVYGGRDEEGSPCVVV